MRVSSYFLLFADNVNKGVMAKYNSKIKDLWRFAQVFFEKLRKFSGFCCKNRA
jgi:hypothetical protein